MKLLCTEIKYITKNVLPFTEEKFMWKKYYGNEIDIY